MDGGGGVGGRSNLNCRHRGSGGKKGIMLAVRRQLFYLGKKSGNRWLDKEHQKRG